MSNAGVTKVKARTEGERGRQVAEIRLSCTEKDIYTIAEVAEILHVNKQLVYQLAKLEEDPLPARRLKYKAREYLVIRQELNEWIERNAPLLQSHVK